MEKLTLEELKNAIREEEKKAREQEDLQNELMRAKIETERAKADKLKRDTHNNNGREEKNRPPPTEPKKSANLTTILFLVSIGATISTTIAFFVLLLVKGRF